MLLYSDVTVNTLAMLHMAHFNWTDLLHESALFTRLTNAEIAELLDVSEEENHENGAIILKEGEAGSHIFIIGIGTVSIALTGAIDHRFPIDSMSVGNFFGEIPCLEKKPRLTTVVADSDCLLLKIPFGEFQQLMDKNARFASKVSLILSGRLRKITEEILAVRLKDVDERLELSNTKLDASLKAIDSQMRAAETILDQTSMRATDVVQSFERTLNQIVSVGKVALLIAAVIVGLLGWFGLDKFNTLDQIFEKTLEDVKTKEDRIEKTLEDVKAKGDGVEKTLADIKAKENEFGKIVESVESKHDDIKKSAQEYNILVKDAEIKSNDFNNIRKAAGTLLGKINEDRKAIYLIRLASGKKFAEDKKLPETITSLYTLLVKYNFSIIVQEGRTDLYKEILAVEDQNITEEVFKQFINGLTATNGQQQGQYTKMIRIGLNRGYTLTDRQKALSYYCLIAASLLVDDEQEYITTRKDFDEFIQGVNEPINFTQDFGPDWFVEHMRSLPENRSGSAKIRVVKDVWRKITNT